MKKKFKTLIKATQTLKKQLRKAFKTYFAKLSKLFIIAILLAISSCGTTSVHVQKPLQGSYTTITVTTNNPITAETPVNTELNAEIKPLKK